MVYGEKKSDGFITLLVVATTAVLLLSVSIYLWTEGLFISEKDQISKITAAIIPESSVVLDRRGDKIGEYSSFYHVQFKLEQIPKPMIEALLAIEDRKFYEHEGVNWLSLGRAALSVVTSGHLKQGGSTITMQLVKNYLLTREKKVSRKLREIVLAYYVEKNLPKTRILELYLNTMYMGHGAYGVGAASLVYFGKPLQELSLPEMALLAGLFQAPSAYDPHKNPKSAIKRQHTVLDAMHSAHMLSKNDVVTAKSTKLEFKPWIPINETVAPFFIAWIKGQVKNIVKSTKAPVTNPTTIPDHSPEASELPELDDRGYKISTTLDRTLQEVANKAVAGNLPTLIGVEHRINARRAKKHDRIDTALLATDASTGAILAMVGGRSFHESQFNRAAEAMRSPGSSFKPVTYSLAIEHHMTWSDLVYVSPVDVGGYTPKNHSGEDLTETTLVNAFAKSLNTPVISLAQKFGIKAVIDRAQQMGVISPMKVETGVAIGGFSATMPDINSVYRVIANHGLRTDMNGVMKIEDHEGHVLYEFDPKTHPATQVFSAETADLLRSGLQAVLTDGTARSIAPMARYAAGKTGTSDDSRDNWFAGFTKDLVVTTWVGGDGNSALDKAASGASLALPIWRDFIQNAKNLAGGSPSDVANNWPIPPNLALVSIDPEYGSPVDHGTSGGIAVLFPKDRLPKKTQATDDMRNIKKDGGKYRELKLGD